MTTLHPLHPNSISKIPIGIKTSYLVLFFLFQYFICFTQVSYISGPDSICIIGPYIFTVENADPSINYDWVASTFGFGLSPYGY